MHSRPEASSAVAKLRQFEGKFGKRFKPCQLLVDMAARGGGFYTGA